MRLNPPSTDGGQACQAPFTPLRDYILIKPSERCRSAILEVIDSELPTQGQVVAVGPGKRDKRGNLRPLDVKIGDQVRFGAGDYLKFPEIRKGNEVYLVLQEADITWINN